MPLSDNPTGPDKRHAVEDVHRELAVAALDAFVSVANHQRQDRLAVVLLNYFVHRDELVRDQSSIWTLAVQRGDPRAATEMVMRLENLTREQADQLVLIYQLSLD